MPYDPTKFLDYTGGGYNQMQGQLGGYLQGQSPWMGSDPYAGDWRTLIGQLQAQASGTGPSLAAEQYKRASGDAFAQQTAMSRGGRSAAGGRQAAMNLSQIGQGMASGLAEARTREQMGAYGALGQALTGAGQQDYQRSLANQGMFGGILGGQLGMNQQMLQALMEKYGADANKTPMWQRLAQLGIGAGLMFGGQPGAGAAVASQGAGG